MKITREQLKHIVRETMIEENEYQTFFKKALEKTGKSIPQMSDEEKKTFFNKIDAAWKGKGEKNEDLVGNQKKLDIDGDGEIDASDLAALRAGKKKTERFGRGVKGPTFGSANESVNEDIKNRFELAYYKDSLNPNDVIKYMTREPSHEERIEPNKFSDMISHATKVAKSKGMNSVEFFYRGMLVGSIDKRNGYKFEKGKYYKKSPLVVNEGIGTIALGVAGGLLLLKVLKFVLKKVVGAVGMNVKLPKEKLLEVVQKTMESALTKISSSGVNIVDIMALQSYLKDEINAGRITTIKQIVQVVDKVSKK